MKRAIAAVLLGVVLFVPAPAGAQGVSVGLKGGAVFASIPQITKDFDGTGIDVGQRLGFIGGGFLTLSVAPGFAIQPEVMFTQKGSDASSPDGDLNFHFDYIDIPVLARVSVGTGPARLYLFGGPSFNFNLKAELDEGGDTSDVKDDVESSEIALVAGLGVEFGKFLIEGRWIEGLQNISKESEDDYKTRTFAIMAGFRF